MSISTCRPLILTLRMFILQIHSIDKRRPFSSSATTSSSAAKPSNHLFCNQSPSSTTSLTSPTESYELAEEACSPLFGFVELPTCPVCLDIFGVGVCFLWISCL
ncbi:hypothetical protein ACSBR1_001691 [Camellia fascicularis]